MGQTSSARCCMRRRLRQNRGKCFGTSWNQWKQNALYLAHERKNKLPEPNLLWLASGETVLPVAKRQGLRVHHTYHLDWVPLTVSTTLKFSEVKIQRTEITISNRKDSFARSTLFGRQRDRSLVSRLVGICCTSSRNSDFSKLNGDRLPSTTPVWLSLLTKYTRVRSLFGTHENLSSRTERLNERLSKKRNRLGRYLFGSRHD